jgi:hypothetical protein
MYSFLGGAVQVSRGTVVKKLFLVPKGQPLPVQRVVEEGRICGMKAWMLCKHRLQCWHLCGKLRQLKGRQRSRCCRQCARPVLAPEQLVPKKAQARRAAAAVVTAIARVVE